MKPFGWSFNSYQQDTDYDCGPCTVQTLMSYHAKNPPDVDILRAALRTTENGTKPESIVEFLKSLKWYVYAVESSPEKPPDDCDVKWLLEHLNRGPIMVLYADWGGHYGLIVKHDLEGLKEGDGGRLWVAHPMAEYDGYYTGVQPMSVVHFKDLWWAPGWLFDGRTHCGWWMLACPQDVLTK